MLNKKCRKCGESAVKPSFVKEGDEIPTSLVTSNGIYCDKCRKELLKEKK